MALFSKWFGVSKATFLTEKMSFGRDSAKYPSTGFGEVRGVDFSPHSPHRLGAIVQCAHCITVHDSPELLADCMLIITSEKMQIVHFTKARARSVLFTTVSLGTKYRVWYRAGIQKCLLKKWMNGF